MNRDTRTAWKLAAFACVIMLGLVGCGQSDAAPKEKSDAGLPPEAVAVRKAFASANASSRGPVEEVLRIVKSGAANPVAYAEALPQLQKFAAGASLTAEQKQTLEALIQKLKTEMAGGAR